MATSTTNFGLTKPAYNESADVAVINTNMDTIDGVMGKNQTASTGAQKAIAIIADGDTHVAITSGQYVYVKNNTHGLAEGLYIASSNVSANANITSSNMTAVSGGGLNALNSNIAPFLAKRGSTPVDITGYTTYSAPYECPSNGYARVGESTDEIRLCGSGSSYFTLIKGSGSGTVAAYVIKGMKIFCTSGATTAKFVPLG